VKREIQTTRGGKEREEKSRKTANRVSWGEREMGRGRGRRQNAEEGLIMKKKKETKIEGGKFCHCLWGEC